MFVYIYAVAAKARREDDDDIVFMAKLDESLHRFNKRKSEAEAAAVASFSFETEDDLLPKGTDAENGGTVKTRKVKVCSAIPPKTSTLSLFLCYHRHPKHNPGPTLLHLPQETCPHTLSLIVQLPQRKPSHLRRAYLSKRLQFHHQ